MPFLFSFVFRMETPLSPTLFFCLLLLCSIHMFTFSCFISFHYQKYNAVLPFLVQIYIFFYIPTTIFTMCTTIHWCAFLLYILKNNHLVVPTAILSQSSSSTIKRKKMKKQIWIECLIKEASSFCKNKGTISNESS